MARETITIHMERYKELIESEKVLDALRTAEVDNWDGYDIAMEYLEYNNE